MTMNVFRLWHLTLVVFFLYSFSIGFYTFYGVYKSYNEYFCKQKRQDLIDYRQTYHLDFVAPEFGKGYMMNVGNMLYHMSPVHNETMDIMYYELGVGSEDFRHIYLLDNKQFELSCKPDFILSRKENFLISGREVIFNNINIMGYRSHEGVLKITNLSNVKPIKLPYDPRNVNSLDEKYKIHGIYCELTRSTENCNLLKSTSDKFYVVYLCSCFSLILLGIISSLNIKDYFLIRVANKIVERLRDFDVFQTINFCNPVDGKPYYGKSGSTIFVLTVGPTNIEDSLGLDRFVDLDGSYTIIGDEVLCKYKNGDGCLIRLDPAQIKNLSIYFKMATVNSSNCVMNDKENHFLKTKDVIAGLLLGKLITTKIKENDLYVLDVHEFELKLLTNSFTDLKKSHAKHLLEHNWRFFSKSYNMQALLNFLNRRTWSTNRPSSVKNCQWKKYTSDVAEIMHGYGFNYKCQVKTKPSATLIEVSDYDWQNFPITVIPEKITIEQTLKPDKNLTLTDKFQGFHNSLPYKEYNFKISTSGGAIKDTPYMDALHALNTEVKALNSKLQFPLAQSSLDLKKEAEEIKNALFDFDKEVNELKPVLLDPIRVYSEKDKHTIKKAERGSGPLENFRNKFTKAPVNRHNELKLSLEYLFDSMNKNFRWALEIENLYEPLSKIEEEFDEFKNSTKIVKEDYKVKEYVEKVIFGKAKPTKGPRRGRHNKKANNRKMLSKSGKTVRLKFLSGCFNDCLNSIVNGHREQSCRARTYHSLRFGLLKSKGLIPTDELLDKSYEGLNAIRLKLLNAINSEYKKPDTSNVLGNMQLLMEGLITVV